MIKCQECRFWDTSTLANNDAEALCRVAAPRVDVRSGGAMWPRTDQDDWCGKAQGLLLEEK